MSGAAVAGAGAGSADVRVELLRAIDAGSADDTLQFAAARGLDHNAVVGAAKSLEARSMLVLRPQSKESLVLTPEAVTYAASGSPEYQVCLAVPAEGASGAWRRRGCCVCVTIRAAVVTRAWAVTAADALPLHG
jgi:hypothetical protein